MHLLRRPLRPQLRPFLISETAADGLTEPLSPVSSSASVTTSSASSSRPSSHTRYLPPLYEGAENTDQVSRVTSADSQQLTMAGRLMVTMNGDEALDTDEKATFVRERAHKKLLAPLKLRPQGPSNALNRSIGKTKPHSLNRTPKHKGLPGLPARRSRSFQDVKSRYADITDDEAYAAGNQFTFNDFILHSSRLNSPAYDKCALNKSILSKYTYKQICELIAKRVWAERGESERVHVQTLTPEIEPFQNRVPMHQIVTEMGAVLRQHMSEILGTQLKMNIRTLPSWRQKDGTHTEILFYEMNGDEGKAIANESSDSSRLRRDTGSEIAVLDSLLRNGTHLDLRAFTLESLPDISLMFSTLVAVDLSYNCLRSVPRELFECRQLEHLCLRHNPISSIAPEMNYLEALTFLDVSFCDLYGPLSENLFGLSQLRHLDVAYNGLTTIPHGISRLRHLQQLVCDGNEIAYLPSSIMSMANLRLVSAKNTWLVPELAKHECPPRPQNLLEILTVRVSRFSWKSLSSKLPDSSKVLLSSVQSCDSCSGSRVSHGYRSIKLCQNLFGIKLLPILFISCTPECVQQLFTNENGTTYIPLTDSFLLNEQFISRLRCRHL